MFEVSSDIYFIVYNLYYVGQNDNLGTRARPINWDGGSMQNVDVSLQLMLRDHSGVIAHMELEKIMSVSWQQDEKTFLVHSKSPITRSVVSQQEVMITLLRGNYR
jgi:hypothetical protein